MATNDIIQNAFTDMAADVLEAYGQKLEGLAAGRTIQGLEEFRQVYNGRISKLRERGYIGPKGWAKLEEAMPTEAKTYFRAFAGGFDMKTSPGFLGFLGAIKDAAAGLDVTTRERILSKFAIAAAGVFSYGGVENESEEADEDE